jgi:hypothetical protein
MGNESHRQRQDPSLSTRNPKVAGSIPARHKKTRDAEATSVNPGSEIKIRTALGTHTYDPDHLAGRASVRRQRERFPRTYGKRQ